MIVPLGAVTWARPAPHAAHALPAERVVAARVQQHQVEAAPRGAHLVEYELRIDQLVFHVARAGDVGLDGNEVVPSADLDRVARVIEQGRAVPRQPAAELADQRLELRPGHVDLWPATDEREAGLAEAPGDQPCIVARVGQRRYVPIGAVADDQGEPLLRPCRNHGRAHEAKHRGDEGHHAVAGVSHSRSPYRYASLLNNAAHSVAAGKAPLIPPCKT